MSEDNDTEKEHEPTPQKLEKARKQGQIVKSADLSVAASYGGLMVVFSGFGGLTLMAMGGALRQMLADPDRLGTLMLGGGNALTGGLLARVAGAAAPWVLGPMLAVLAVLFAQRAFIFVPDKLTPKLNRINPIAAAGQKFGRTGLFEFGKSTVKMTVVSIVLFQILRGRLGQIMTAQQAEVPAGMVAMTAILHDFLMIVLIAAITFAAIDYLWQYFEHIRRNRMSRQEMIDEFKDSEGDPHMKGQRQQRAREIASNRMLADVPRADVVIVNPTHYAVALRWQRGGGQAPVCVAKGVDAMAARIRAIAAENGVPIRSDPPTARAIYASVEIGAEIRRDHYRAVAAAIRYAEMIRRRARARGEKIAPQVRL
ncbi:flagellar type III secretion system protein FlhB [Paracoccus sp. p4-l81]|uniref:flagellar type III secretion system protein FlhB n=1 Tax=unclassified Paracoccus (in: a-proteobacteria) TaxID=2688777 RepID=UPI0035B6E463